MKRVFKQLGKKMWVFLFVFVFCFVIPTYGAEVEELPENAIAIYSPDELDMICNEYPADGYYYLVCDIDMSEVLSEFGEMYNGGAGWNPIGTESVPFSGTFDGRGYKITGLTINRSTSYVGLFGYAKNAEIKNLVVEDGNVTGGDYTAVLLGKGINTILTDCTVDGGSVLSSGSYVAGIAGALTEETGVVLNSCSNSASVTGAKNVAGIVGTITGTDYEVKECFNSGDIVSTSANYQGYYIGGVAADALSGTFIQCGNSGGITSQQVQRYVVGGIAGRATSVIDCENSGNISTSLYSLGPGSTGVPNPDTSYVGGIVGVATNVENCVNTGGIDGQGGSYNYFVWYQVYAYVSGIAAQTEQITRCYNCGTVTGNPENSYLTAILSYPSGSVSYCFGYNAEVPLATGGNDITLKNCYNLDGIIASEGKAEKCYYYAEEASGVGELRTKRQLRVKNTFENWDFANVWTMEGNEDYLYPELIDMEPDYKKSAVSISMVAFPEKTTYLEEKEQLDLTGAKIRVTYDNETTETISVTEEMISGFNNTVVGKNTVTVTYGTGSATFEVEIIAKTLIDIALTTVPDKVKFLEQKDDLEVVGGVLTLYYNNDTTATKKIDKTMVKGFDNTIVGKQTLTVSYGGKTTSYEVEILAKSVSSIKVTTLPEKVIYLESKDELEVTGGKLTVYYDNDTREIIDMTLDMVSGFDNTKIGKQTLNVSYEGKVTSYEVEISQKSITHIKVTTLPERIVYLEAKDQLEVTGGKLTLYYDNDTREIIDMTLDMISGFDNTKVGKQTLNVSYEGKVTSYEVEILQKRLSAIGVTTFPEKVTYLEEKDELEVIGGKLTLYYDNDTRETVNMTLDMVTGFDNTKIGKQTLNVSYEGKVTSYEVEVLAKSVSYIRVATLPEKVVYLEAKEELDVTGGRLTVYYDNDTSETIDMTVDMVTNFDNTKIGSQTVTVSYGNKSTTYNVEIIPKTLLTIEVTTLPKKVIYLEAREDLEVTGGMLTLYYNNDTSETISMTLDMVTGFDNTKIGKQTLNVSYREKATTYDVMVMDKQLESIRIEKMPEKLSYEEGEVLDLSGGEISLIYDNEQSVTMQMSNEMISGFDSSKGGKITLTVTYGGKSTEFEIEVHHDYKESVTEPTCEEEGYTTYTCAGCQDTYVDHREDALGHSFSNYIYDADASSDTKDAMTAKCDRCEETDTIFVDKKLSVTKVFSDVHNDWYVEYVQYVYDNHLMTGIKGTTRFEPNSNITKAQVAQVLYNMEGQPGINSMSVFRELKDVYVSEWYANAVAWAYNTGVVTGDTNAKKFFPNADVTREQLAIMMYRYAQYKGYDTSKMSDLSGLKNAENTANWALDGVKWAVGTGLISGIEKNGVKDLAPQGNATRAQVAAILQRFCEFYEK